MLYGYARVSTQEQETHAQIDALNRANCGRIFQEKRSGGTMRRPVLESLLCQLRAGDTLIVYKLDRVARSLKDLLIILDRIEAAGAKFSSLTELIDTRTPAGRMILQILGAVAEFERALIRERTTAGLHAAMARGARPGRPRSLGPKQEKEALRLWRTQQYTKTALADHYGTHISSIKRLISRQHQRQNTPARPQRQGVGARGPRRAATTAVRP